MPRSCLWPRDFTFGCRGWGGLGVTLGGGDDQPGVGKGPALASRKSRAYVCSFISNNKKKALLMLERG